MPHKHTRSRVAANESSSSYNLPPTTVAKPLPAFTKHATPAASSTRKRKRGNNSKSSDDTPRAFQRLMAMQQSGKRLASGLDDGNRPTKKKKKQQTGDTSSSNTKEKKQQSAFAVPKILPGEKLSDFSARVNQALPLSSVSRKGGSSAGLTKERQTRMEKKLQRMQNEWREQDKKRRDQAQEVQEAQDEAEAEQLEGLDTSALAGASSAAKRKGKKGKKKRGKGQAEDGAAADNDYDSDGDPWARLKQARGPPPALHDVAQAPPEFRAVPRERFKAVPSAGGAHVRVDSIPAAAGSLRRREALGEARADVIARYRELMAQRRSGGGDE